ncbi:NYNRIN-like protein [Tanacetum coccineum]
MIRKVQHPEWVANTIPIKLANGTWKVQVDICPFPEEGEELASLMEYPYKCFLRLLKEYSQIRMAENDEEKIGFHTKNGVYCFTHMPKGLKNSTETHQRMMDKVLTDQRGRNVEVYLEEIVVKRKNEQSLVHDVEETLRKLKSVNIKIDPNTSSFRVEEGKFIGHIVTKEGVRAYPEKAHIIIRSPTSKSPSQIRSLFLQLTTISKFIPKLVELKYPINKARMRMDAVEGEKLMLCLRHRNETISSVLMVEREGVQTLVSYVSRSLQGMEICYTPTEKIMQALIHTIRSLRTTFRKHKVAVITDGPMEEILKLSERKGRLEKWAAKIRTYDISYIQRKEAEGSEVKKLF